MWRARGGSCADVSSAMTSSAATDSVAERSFMDISRVADAGLAAPHRSGCSMIGFGSTTQKQ